MFVFFGQKMVLLKAFHPLKIYQNTKFNGPKLTGESFCVHLRSSNVRNFGMVEARVLKAWC
jgi:hypothetical protein